MSMSLSDSLRNRTDQHKVKNEISKEQDRKISSIANQIVSDLEEKYPDLEFGWHKKLLLSDIQSTVVGSLDGSKFSRMTRLELEPVRPNTYITPDGGFIFVKVDGKKKYICISEEKTQGTNDKRLLEGKKKQGRGNAAERLAKNYNTLDFLFTREDIFPFVAFLQGCDFHEDYTIGDRIKSVYRFLPQNKINLYKDEMGRGGSYFMRGHLDTEKPGTSEWSFTEMYNVMMDIAEMSLDHYC